MCIAMAIMRRFQRRCRIGPWDWSSLLSMNALLAATLLAWHLRISSAAAGGLIEGMTAADDWDNAPDGFDGPTDLQSPPPPPPFPPSLQRPTPQAQGGAGGQGTGGAGAGAGSPAPGLTGPAWPPRPPPRPPAPSSWVNLALGRTAYSSSLLASSMPGSTAICGRYCGPSLATDGDIQRSRKEFRSAGYNDYTPWLSVDLGTTAAVVQRIVLYGNTLSAPVERVELRVGNVSITNTNGGDLSLGSNPLVWSATPAGAGAGYDGATAAAGRDSSSGGGSGGVLDVFLDVPAVGRWVTVQRISVKGASAAPPELRVSEIQVYGRSPSPPVSPQRYQIRLVGGRAPNSGRVEIYDGRKWGTVCDTLFGDTEATVVCKELGYASGIAVPAWGGGTGPILLSGVHCDLSQDARLYQCDSTLLAAPMACRHPQDVGVFCKETPWTKPSQSPPRFTPDDVKAGNFFTCALSAQSRGSIKCFGRNFYGQLGLGDSEPRGDLAGRMGGSLPVVDLGLDMWPAGQSVTSVSVGAAHACAVLQPGGFIKCWGRNQEGQLGLGDRQSRGDDLGEMGYALPVVDLGPGLTVSAVAAGWFHTCAILQPGGVVKCWGGNAFGQLGLGDTTSRGDQPGQMGAALPAVDLGRGLKAVALAAGAGHTCALLRPGNVVKCWGVNAAGQLGLGDATPRGSMPGQMGDALPAVDLGRGLYATALSAGSSHTCAVLQPGGVIKCWGANNNAQLGLGDLDERGSAAGQMGRALKPVDLGSGLTAAAVTAGSFHTCAVLQPGGIVKCWGANDVGQLGLGSGDSKRVGNRPSEMGTALPPVDLGPGLTAVAISAGSTHTCALLQPGSLVKCWGANSGYSAGTLGVGDAFDRGLRPGDMGANLPSVQL